MRLETIKSLNALMTPAHLAGLRLFSDRFKGRILEMAESDSDDAARLSAIEALVKLGTLELLDEEDASAIVPLLFDENVKIRVAAGPLIPGLLEDKQLTESGEARSQLKLLCQLLLENPPPSKNESEGEAFSSTQYDDMGFEEEEVFRMRVRDRNDLVDWFTKPTGKSCPLPSLSATRAKNVVEALWTELPLVQVSFSLTVVHKMLIADCLCRTGRPWVTICQTVSLKEMMMF